MFSKRLSVPQDVAVQIDDHTITVRFDGIDLVSYYDPLICTVKLEAEEVVFEARRDRRMFAAKTNTFAQLVRNNVRGMTTPFERRLQIFYRHFPMKVEVRGAEVVITKFLGETAARRAKILRHVTVEINEGERTISVRGPSLPAVTQTAANIEQACKIRHLDRRIFQDGIYLINDTK